MMDIFHELFHDESNDTSGIVDIDVFSRKLGQWKSLTLKKIKHILCVQT